MDLTTAGLVRRDDGVSTDVERTSPVRLSGSPRLLDDFGVDGTDHVSDGRLTGGEVDVRPTKTEVLASPTAGSGEKQKSWVVAGTSCAVEATVAASQVQILGALLLAGRLAGE